MSTLEMKGIAMNDQMVGTEVDGDGIGWITINRPDKLNALSSAVVIRMREVVRDFEVDSSVKVIVIRGAGKAFSVGYDIAEEVEAQISRAEDWHAVLTRNVDLSMSIWSSTKPTIASVNGWCLAGACEVAMACDLVVASERSQFGEPEIRFGSGPVTLLMPFLIGQKKTNELLFTGDVISAQEAERIGMINRVVPSDDLDSTVRQLAKKIATTPPVTLKFTKLALIRAYEAMGLRQAVTANIDVQATLNAAYSPERTEFGERVARDGLREALNWRDSRYGKL